MEFFPFRSDRQQADEMRRNLTNYISKSAYGFAAVELKKTGECVGFNGLFSNSDLQTFFSDEIVEIGWRLAPQFWGNGYASEAASKWLEYGFTTLDLNEIVSFSVWNNIPSFAVMEHIGMTPDPSRDFNNPKVPDSHPHLKRHLFYKISKDEWIANLNKKGD